MNKAELIDIIAERNNNKYTKVMIQEILDSEKAIIKETVAKGEDVKLIGFGTFEARKQAARVVKIPNKKEIVNSKEKMVPKFNSSKDFKEQVEKLQVSIIKE